MKTFFTSSISCRVRTAAAGARRAEKRIPWLRMLLTSLAMLGSVGGIRAQSLPIENLQDAIRYNLSSTNGLPISSVRGVPPGSDGRAPVDGVPTPSNPSGAPATTNQFRGLTVFGAVGRPGTTNLNPAVNLAANAENLNLPRIKVGGVIVMAMIRARVGAPMLSRSTSLQFGEIVALPVTDEHGVLLSVANTGASPNRPATSPDDYWLAEPYTANNHTNAGYYWSPHAQAVFAINPGPMQIVWRRSTSSTVTTNRPGVGSVLVLGIPYVVFTNQHLVSGSPVKDPRLMYWTERSFVDTGKPVFVPSARVGAVNVVYNNNFPERVTNEVVIPGQVPVVTSNTLAETRTLWYDKSGAQSGGQIHAYNVEGRVFMELLGDFRGAGIRQHLGFEIVDVIRQPAPSDVTVDLGELLTAYPGGIPGDAELFPEPLFVVGESFAFQHNPGGRTRPDFYATRETRNQNDLQLHWLEEGLEGLKWPFRFVRYNLVWPNDAEKYSHYIRPVVTNENDAQATAVALPSQNGPTIAYQDPLDRPRGKLTDSFAYYSFLDAAHPAHRALLRFTVGDYIRFERVFSWLDETLRGPDSQFAGSVATNLNSWTTNNTFNWPDEFTRPRVISSTVFVGDRITAPAGEFGAAPDTNYLAGFIRQTEGDLFHPGAYVDPFTAGFETAGRSAIIPVNTMPGKNRLEVWWFRQNQVNVSRGFKNSFWPAVIGRYTVQYPTAPPEIVLASDDGSGPLPSLQARGSIYYQNDAKAPGYNPNEEHALMQGGQAFALRDDLNITTNTNGEYSSHPFVLVSYTEADGRPAVRSFKVLREKPAAGIVFDYRKEAGAILQPPMPLPLMEKALAPNVAGQPPKNLNTEINGYVVASSLRSSAGAFSNQIVTTTGRHFVLPYDPVALQDPLNPAPPYWLFPTNVGATTLEGPLCLVRPVTLRAWDGIQSPVATRWRFAAELAPGIAANASALLYDTVTTNETVRWAITVAAVNTASNYVEVEFGATTPEAAKNANRLVLPISGPAANAFVGQRLASEPLATNLVNLTLRERYASFTFQDRKANTWVHRGPHDDHDAPVLVMKYYYKTLPGFFFPSLALDAQPAVGTVTPYLRGRNPNGSFEGDPVFGNRQNPAKGDGQPLGITYRPVWPENAPVLQMAESLLTPKRGLPGVRGNTSLEIIYQQSQINGGEESESAVLHDPTREKSFAFAAPDSADTLDLIPPSVRTQSYQGRTFFPALPPHLAERLFFDPNRGDFGTLVFKGQFVNAALGDSYVSLNVIGPGDATEMKSLCATEDPRKARWDAAIDGLSTTLELFIENPAQPGTYIPSSPETVGPAALSRVRDDDVAVDSYALTATGPGVGYLSLLAGNGRAFTPEGDPVSVKILKVVKTLYRGEVNIVESSNPLNEKLSLQQVVDLAGLTEDYNFEWLIASPVDGLPPAVYQNTPITLLGDGIWRHLHHPLSTETAATATAAAASRIFQDVSSAVAPLSRVPFDSVVFDDGLLRFEATDGRHGLSSGNKVVVRK